MKRPYKLWTVLSKLHYLYIPLLLMVMFGTMGGIRGVQNKIDNWIDDSQAPIGKYLSAYVPEIKMNVDFLHNQMTLEEGLDALIMQAVDLPENPQLRKFYLMFNTSLIYALMDELGYPREIDGLILFLRQADVNTVDASFFEAIPQSLKNFNDAQFNSILWGVFLGFMPFLLIALVELAVAFFYTKYAYEAVGKATEKSLAYIRKQASNLDESSS
ncbi:MAG: hypothetical protein AAFP00_07375 [Bacteroidota bacterium]